MTGLRYGTSDGARYGSSDGAHWSPALDNWLIDGVAAIVSTPTADAATLSLSFEAARADIDHWRQYDRSGDLSVETGYGGQFRAIDRGGRSSTVTIEPPSDMSPPFPTAEYYVSSYSESQQSADRVDIDLTAQRLSNRGDVFQNLSQSGGDWSLSLQTGTVTLDESHVSPSSGSGTTSGPEYDLTLALSDLQAAALMDNWGYPEGVVERNVGDGTNFLVDESPSTRQTATVSSPSGAIIDDGDYLVTGWQIEQAGFEASRRWSVDVTLAES